MNDAPNPGPDFRAPGGDVPTWPAPTEQPAAVPQGPQPRRRHRLLVGALIVAFVVLAVGTVVGVRIWQQRDQGFGRLGEAYLAAGFQCAHLLAEPRIDGCQASQNGSGLMRWQGQPRAPIGIDGFARIGVGADRGDLEAVLNPFVTAGLWTPDDLRAVIAVAEAAPDQPTPVATSWGAVTITGAGFIAAFTGVASGESPQPVAPKSFPITASQMSRSIEQAGFQCRLKMLRTELDHAICDRADGAQLLLTDIDGGVDQISLSGPPEVFTEPALLTGLRSTLGVGAEPLISTLSDGGRGHGATFAGVQGREVLCWDGALDHESYRSCYTDSVTWGQQ